MEKKGKRKDKTPVPAEEEGADRREGDTLEDLGEALEETADKQVDEGTDKPTDEPADEHADEKADGNADVEEERDIESEMLAIAGPSSSLSEYEILEKVPFKPKSKDERDVEERGFLKTLFVNWAVELGTTILDRTEFTDPETLKKIREIVKQKPVVKAEPTIRREEHSLDEILRAPLARVDSSSSSLASDKQEEVSFRPKKAKELVEIDPYLLLKLNFANWAVHLTAHVREPRQVAKLSVPDIAIFLKSLGCKVEVKPNSELKNVIPGQGVRMFLRCLDHSDAVYECLLPSTRSRCPCTVSPPAEDDPSTSKPMPIPSVANIPPQLKNLVGIIVTHLVYMCIYDKSLLSFEQMDDDTLKTMICTLRDCSRHLISMSQTLLKKTLPTVHIQKSPPKIASRDTYIWKWKAKKVPAED